jgi:hypothetical protein
MKTLVSALCLVALIAASALVPKALAWTPDSADENRIVALIAWQDNMTNVVIVTSSGHYCHFDSKAANGHTLLSTVLAAKLSNKGVSLACYDEVENIGGYDSHRLHRIAF